MPDNTMPEKITIGETGNTPMSRDEIVALLNGEGYFQVTKAGVVYDIGTGEGGETVCAWRAADPEDARCVTRFGRTSASSGRPLPEVADAIVAWLAEAPDAAR